jgi:hypothetical protein
MGSAKKDDLEAVRDIAEMLKDFSDDERERVIRWVREKLGMAAGAPAQALMITPAPAAGAGTAPAVAAAGVQVRDIKAFVASKQPKSDNQFAAVVAYFHRFVAAGDDRKDTITSDDLVNACRLADWKRPARPAQVLVNTYHNGLLDRADTGSYRITTVGENLVAMVLPGGSSESGGRKPAKRSKKKAKKAKGKK